MDTESHGAALELVRGTEGRGSGRCDGRLVTRLAIADSEQSGRRAARTRNTGRRTGHNSGPLGLCCTLGDEGDSKARANRQLQLEARPGQAGQEALRVSGLGSAAAKQAAPCLEGAGSGARTLISFFLLLEMSGDERAWAGMLLV